MKFDGVVWSVPKIVPLEKSSRELSGRCVVQDWQLSGLRGKELPYNTTRGRKAREHRFYQPLYG